MAKYQLVIEGAFADAIKGMFYGWVGINGGKIAGFSHDSKPYSGDFEDILVFDSECLILPGFVDTHVHCREPGKDYKEDWRTLGLAAAHGGVTTIATMPNYGEGNSIITKERLNRVIELSDKCIVDKRLWAGLCPDNLDSLEELNHPLVAGYKGFTTSFDPDLTFPRKTEKEFFGMLGYAVEKAKETGKPSVWHCEDETLFDEKARNSGTPWAYSDWRTEESEYRMVGRMVEIARKCGARIHIPHVSSSQSFEIVKGYPMASCEATWHHQEFLKYKMAHDRRLVMNPPLRGWASANKIRKMVNIGYIPMIGSDHAPHKLEEKSRENPPAGVPAEDFFGSLVRERMFSGEMTPEIAVRVTSLNPARFLKLYDRGLLDAGMRADFAVLRMYGNGREMKTYSKCGWNPYPIRDYMEATIIEGKVVFRVGEPVVDV